MTEEKIQQADVHLAADDGQGFAASRGEAAGDRTAAPTQPEALLEIPPGYVLVPDWKGYALLGTGMYCIEHSAAPPDPELGAELIIRLATEKDRAGNRQIGEQRDTDGSPIQPETMAVRIGFLSAAALDALEAQLRLMRAENFPESIPTGQSRTSEAGEATCASNEPDEQDTDSLLPLPQPTGERE